MKLRRLRGGPDQPSNRPYSYLVLVLIFILGLCVSAKAQTACQSISVTYPGANAAPFEFSDYQTIVTAPPGQYGPSNPYFVAVSVSVAPGCTWALGWGPETAGNIAQGSYQGSQSFVVAMYFHQSYEFCASLGDCQILEPLIVDNSLPPCFSSISPTQVSVPAQGGSGTVTVTSNNIGCSWIVGTPSADWLTVGPVSPANPGYGNGTVAYSVGPSAITRTATVSIAGQTFTVTQPNSACQSTTGPCITSPSDGASPQSQFVAISGTGIPGDTLNVLADGNPVGGGSVVVDSEGNWEALPYVALYGSSVTIQVQDQTSSNSSNTITVHPSLAAFPPGPSSPANSLTALLPLRKADILVMASDTSPQYKLYGPTYTHTALYLGGDSNGTPLIAEAITAAEAGSGIGAAGQVRSISLDQSYAWTQSKGISALRPMTPLSGAARTAIVTEAQSITSQGLPYWTDGDLGLIAGAWAMYTTGYTGRMNQYLNAIYNNTTSTQKFICSTLVWHAYLTGSGLDIARPNFMTAQSGFLARYNPAFLNFLKQPPSGCAGCPGSVFIVPETFAQSPLLSKIF